MKTRLYSHEDCLNHLTPPGHPERPDRLRAIAEALDRDAFGALDRAEAPLADPEWMAQVHGSAYRDRIEAAVPAEGMVAIDADTSASPGSWQAALRAAGAAVAGVDAVFGGEIDNAFAAVRPPGHHAEQDRAMGFCLFNSIAIAAWRAQTRHGADRVAIVDFDVHHGNGTQDIFWKQPSVLFASTHQMPLYPGTGALNETGAGNIFNAPLRHGDGGAAFRAAMNERVLPAVEGFKPDIVLVSAGFDAHQRDPLAGLELTANDFDWITGKLMDIADRHAGGRLVSLLEGGYDLQGLAESVSAHVNRLMHG